MPQEAPAGQNPAHHTTRWGGLQQPQAGGGVAERTASVLCELSGGGFGKKDERSELRSDFHTYVTNRRDTSSSRLCTKMVQTHTRLHYA